MIAIFSIASIVCFVSFIAVITSQDDPEVQNPAFVVFWVSAIIVGFSGGAI